MCSLFCHTAGVLSFCLHLSCNDASAVSALFASLNNAQNYHSEIAFESVVDASRGSRRGLLQRKRATTKGQGALSHGPEQPCGYKIHYIAV